jgi:hypothetical protein
VLLRARASSRVPFGTGPAVARLLFDADGLRLYHPEIFVHLRGALEAIGETASAFVNGRPDFLPLRDSEALRILGVDGISGGLQRACRAATTPELARERAFEWFDGFRTLKFVRGLQRAGYGPVGWRDALAHRVWSVEQHRSIEEVRRSLAEAEPRRCGRT